MDVPMSTLHPGKEIRSIETLLNMTVPRVHGKAALTDTLLRDHDRCLLTATRD